MDKYYIKAIILEGCLYSANAVKLLKEYNIISDIEYISHNNKELYKSDKIQTFPQIYLKKYNSKGHLLLGGYNDLNNFINTFKNNNYTENDIFEFMKKTEWSKLAVEKLIKLINIF